MIPQDPLQGQVRGPGPLPGPAVSSDEELLVAIVQRRDQEAFNAFYGRHEEQLFRLASHLACDLQEAQDIFQEAMIRIWWACRNYRPQAGASALAYVARILVHEALKAQRSRKRQQVGEKKFSTHRQHEITSGAAPADQERQNLEIASLLKDKLRRMPERDRQLAALYFGCGLTQTQVAEALNLPQRTVSHNLQRLVGGLRVALTRTGLAGLAILDLEAALRGELAEAPPLASTLRSAIWKEIEARPDPRLVSGPRSLLASGIKVALLVAIAAVGLGSLTSGGSGPATRSATVPPPAGGLALQPSLGTGASARADRLYKLWTFEAGPAADLELLRGAWRHLSIRGVSGMAMRTEDNDGAVHQGTIFSLPFRAAAPPLRIDFRGWFLDGKKIARFRSTWSGERGFSPYRVWHQPNFLVTGHSRGTSYLLDRAVIEINQGRVFRVQLFEPEPDRTRIVLNFDNFLLERLEVRSLGAEEVPLQYRDPRALIAAQALVEDLQR